jgi:glucosamine kinase
MWNGPESDRLKMREFRIGIDGGGSGTRACVRDRVGNLAGLGHGGPSALAQGRAAAWRGILDAIRAAFRNAGVDLPPLAELEVAIGISGAEVEALRAEFLASSPGFGDLRVATDGTTSLLGAHGNAPGAMVACGTGVVGEALHADGRRTTVSGWGFPHGDEGGGAWLGQRALAMGMQAMDARLPASPLSEAILELCGRDRFAMLDWTSRAGQAEFAALAPMVFEQAERDPCANQLLDAAAAELDRVAFALDPAQELPITILGSVGQRIADRMVSFGSRRHVPPRGSSLDGAFLLFESHAEYWS